MNAALCTARTNCIAVSGVARPRAGNPGHARMMPGGSGAAACTNEWFMGPTRRGGSWRQDALGLRSHRAEGLVEQVEHGPPRPLVGEPVIRDVGRTGAVGRFV